MLFALLQLILFIGLWADWQASAYGRYALTGVMVLTLGYLVWFYRKAIKPWRAIENGMNLLNEQDFSSRLSPVGQYEADNTVKVFNRMMSQLKSERLHVREQNHFLDLLFQASPMGILIFDIEEHISSMNPAAERFFGSPFIELREKRLQDMELMLAKELAVLPMNSSNTVRLNDSTIYKCSRSSFLDRGVRHAFILIEPLTEEVVRAEKKAYEKVIRMISHEVNNTVAGVTSTLDTLVSTLEDTEESGELCDLMRVCIERCYSMSRFITNFADVVKIPDPQPTSEDLNEIVCSHLQFMESVCQQRQIGIKTDLCSRAIPVQLDAILFQQVLINIIKNAAESIGENGTICITTRQDTSMLEIADNGAGISEEAASRLFTPFFSTKPTGQGIGLMFIREVLTKHHCTFSLRTGKDGWTRFRIFFN